MVNWQWNAEPDAEVRWLFPLDPDEQYGPPPWWAVFAVTALALAVLIGVGWLCIVVAVSVAA